MNEKQFRQSVENKQGYQGPKSLGEYMDRQVKQAGSEARKMRKVGALLTEFWEGEEGRKWMEVGGIGDDWVLIKIREPVVGERFRAQSREFQRLVAANVSGIRKVHCLVAAGFDEDR